MLYHLPNQCHQQGTRPSTREAMGAFHVHTIQVTNELGARLPEMPSLGSKIHALLLSAVASFDRQVPCEQVAVRSLTWRGQGRCLGAARWKGQTACACVSGTVQAHVGEAQNLLDGNTSI